MDIGIFFKKPETCNHHRYQNYDNQGLDFIVETLTCYLFKAFSHTLKEHSESAKDRSSEPNSVLFTLK